MRKKEQVEQEETEASLMEYKSKTEKLEKDAEIRTKEVEQLIQENEKLKQQIKMLQRDKAELVAKTSIEGKLVVAIDDIAKGIYEKWCEVYEIEMPEEYAQNAEWFKGLGFTPNRYNMPILKCITAFMGFESPEFAELTEENLQNGAKKYQK